VFPRISFRPGYNLAPRIREAAKDSHLPVGRLIRRAIEDFFYRAELDSFLSVSSETNLNGDKKDGKPSKQCRS